MRVERANIAVFAAGEEGANSMSEKSMVFYRKTANFTRHIWKTVLFYVQRQTIPALRFAKKEKKDGFTRFLTRLHGCKSTFPNSATCRR